MEGKEGERKGEERRGGVPTNKNLPLHNTIQYNTNLLIMYDKRIQYSERNKQKWL